jgi:phage shock protein PspC (stress-responsive transcriptional regulator)
MKKIQSFIEKNAFGVCSYLGNKLRIHSDYIRIFFIYASFITLGSPVIVYLIIAFWVKFILPQKRRHTIWDI